MDTIKTINDVKHFFRFLYKEKKLAFHPDESFESYVRWGDNIPTFTLSECKKYDYLMNQCFDVCMSTGVDIYETAIEIRDNDTTE